MANFTTVKSDWVANEVVTADDVNRIEGNAEGGAKPSYQHSSTVGAAVAVTSTSYQDVVTLNHVTYTGRIKITAQVSAENATATSANLGLTVTRDGTDLGHATYSMILFTIRVGDFASGALETILSGLTPGQTYVIKLRARRHTGTTTSPTLRNYFFSTVDT